jgi:poly(hydroxyalkanoate) granule-associated protein
MASTKDTASFRKRPRQQASGRASAGVPPKAHAKARRGRAGTEAAQLQLLQAVQQIWLAGMGAMARGQRDGPAAFQDAVVEGLRLLNRSRSAAQDMVRDAFESAQETLQLRVGNAREQAQETMDNIEALFQSRVQRVMHQMGVPTAEEIRVLTRRVSELNENVRKLNTRARPGKAARPGPAGRMQKRKRSGTAASARGAGEVT